MGVGGGMVVAVAVAEAAALFAVASKAKLRFIAIKSFVLSATVDAVTMHLSDYLTGRGDIMTKIDAQEGRAARARCFKTADDGHFDTETVTVLSHKTHTALTT